MIVAHFPLQWIRIANQRKARKDKDLRYGSHMHVDYTGRNNDITPSEFRTLNFGAKIVHNYQTTYGCHQIMEGE